MTVCHNANGHRGIRAGTAHEERAGDAMTTTNLAKTIVGWAFLIFGIALSLVFLYQALYLGWIGATPTANPEYYHQIGNRYFYASLISFVVAVVGVLALRSRKTKQ